MKKSILIKIINTAIIIIIFNISATAQYKFRTNITPESDKQKEIITKLLDDNLPGHYSKSNDTIQTSEKEKNIYYGAILSGLIPGTGQIYAKSYIKAAIFIAIETGLWIAYGIYQKKGNDQTDFYQNYADANWDVYRYAQWLKEQNFPGASEIDLGANKEILRGQINICESQNFSHTLPPYGDQQYYEVIGKYQNFLKGWSDAIGKDINKNNYGTYRLQQVDYYMNERQIANDYYGYGTTSLMIVILNHIASGIDGILSVKSYNKKITAKGNLSFTRQFSYKTGKFGIYPQANFTINF